MVHIILVVYDKGHNISIYKKVFFKIFKKYSLIIVNNGKETIYNSYLGTNAHREFSGYYEGYNRIKNLVRDSDLIVFANDTLLERRKFNGYFLNAYRIYYNLCKYKIIRGLYIIGEIHGIDEKIFEHGPKLNKHISTYFFITNKLTLEKIDISYMNINFEIEYDIRRKTFESKLLSRDYINRINKWLIKDKNNNYQWYKSENISIENIDSIVSKAKAVFKEHYLSHLCVVHGVRLIPIYSTFKYSISRVLLYIFNKV